MANLKLLLSSPERWNFGRTFWILHAASAFFPCDDKNTVYKQVSVFLLAHFGATHPPSV